MNSFIEFPEKDFANAVASVLSGGVRATELQTYVQAAGYALAPTSGLKDFYEEKGVSGGTQAEMLRALADAELNTSVKLYQEGLTEQRQRKAMAILVRDIADVERIRGVIGEEAVPGMIPEMRAAMEAGDPMLRRARQAKVLAAQAAVEQVIGPHAAEAQEQELIDRASALAFRKLGVEQSWPFDVIDEQGRTSAFQSLMGLMKLNSLSYRARQSGGDGGGATNHYHGPVYNLPDPALQPDERSVVVSTE